MILGLQHLLEPSPLSWLNRDSCLIHQPQPLCEMTRMDPDYLVQLAGKGKALQAQVLCNPPLCWEGSLDMLLSREGPTAPVRPAHTGGKARSETGDSRMQA